MALKIDRTAPISIASISPDVPNGNNGWYTSEVTVSLDASDDASGVAITEYQVNDGDSITYTGSIPAFGDGIYTVNYRIIDQAGNVEQTRTIVFKVDTTGPSLTIKLDRTSIWPPNHKMVTILAEVNGSDSLSGIESIVLSSITSNEPDQGTDAEDQPNDIQDAEMDTFDTSFSLRAERSGEGTGRIYTITYTATDKAGNQTVVPVTVTVPHDKSVNE